MKDKVFLKAFWESSHSALVFLTQDWECDSLRLPLFLKPDTIRFELERASAYDIARLSGYYMHGDAIRFVLDPSLIPLHEIDNHLYVAGDFNGWDQAIGREQYLLSPFEMEGNPVYVVDVPLAELGHANTARFRFVSESHAWLSVPDNAPNLVPNRYQGSDYHLSRKQGGRHVFRLRTLETVNLQTNVRLEWHDQQFSERIAISNSEFYLSQASELPMGVTREGDELVFRLFAPRASRVTLELFKSTPKTGKTLHHLVRNSDGSWEIRLPLRYDRFFYFYYVDGINHDGSTYFDYTVPVVDPYAKAMASSTGPGIVVDPSRLTPLVDGFHPPLWHDLVIAEVHLRDVMAKSRVDLSRTERMQYSGLARWLKHERNYLKSLGVNALEFQPLHEFEYGSKDDYHWGYMPVNYFSPASCNEKYPKSAQQIEGFKEIVRATHEAGFAFILDVVYNHMGSPNALLSIDKHYYYDVDSNFNLTNWSGVGNDLRCWAPMAKRLIIDSLKYYVTHFGVDGFRFDLAELIRVDVLTEIEQELKAVKPSVILIAEPWSFKGHIGEKLRSTGFSSWNDRFRNFFVHYLRGEGSPDDLKFFLKGSPGVLTRFPAQTVNYSESHDDYCWIDLITENPERDGSFPTVNDVRRTHLMFSILFMSLGIPMMSAGQDFIRSKRGIRNTYQHGEVNALDYDRLTQFSGTHDYVRSWIRFRLSAAGHLLRLEFQPSDEFFEFFDADNGSRALAVVLNASQERGRDQLIFAINPGEQACAVRLKADTLEGATQIADHMRFDAGGVGSALVHLDGELIHLPPLSCALWIKH